MSKQAAQFFLKFLFLILTQGQGDRIEFKAFALYEDDLGSILDTIYGPPSIVKNTESELWMTLSTIGCDPKCIFWELQFRTGAII